jgi:hypothetical protein
MGCFKWRWRSLFGAAIMHYVALMLIAFAADLAVALGIAAFIRFGRREGLAPAPRRAR